MTDQAWIECPECNGMGEVVDIGYGGDAYDFKCDECNGTGVVQSRKIRV